MGEHDSLLRIMRGVVSLSAVLLSVGCQGFQGQTFFSRATIGAAGGQLESLDGVFTIIIPPGALAQDEEFRIEDLAQPPRGAIGPAYEVRPNIILAVDARFIYDFSMVDVGAGRDLNLLNIAANFRLNNRDQWTPLQRESVDTTARTVTAVDSDIGFYYGLIQDDSLSGDTAGTDSDTSDTDMTAGTTDTTAGPGPLTSSSETGDEDGNESSTTGDLPETDTESSTTGTTAQEESTSSGTATSGTAECEDGSVDPGEVCLSELRSVAIAGEPTALLSFDIDDDGNLDVIVGAGEDIYDLRGNGAGTLSSENIYMVADGFVALAKGDFDGDGAIDLVVLRSDGTLGVMLNDGGSFEDPLSVALDGDTPTALLAAHLDRDTDLDLAVLNAGSNDFSVLLGEGDGTFGSAPVFGALEAPLTFAVGDLNGDDGLDIVSLNASSVGVSLGNGMGLFSDTPGTTAIGTAIGQAVATADFNDDGYADVAVATDANRVVVYPSDDLGRLVTGGLPYSVGENPVAMVAADVSGDDIADILTANAADGTVSILLGRGNGAFEETVTLDVGSNPSSLAVGDYNGDDALDVVVGRFDTTGRVTLLLSAP